MNVRNKGANGERELAKWLFENFDLEHMPERNLEQVRSGGSDIINIYPFFFECKRVEVLDLQSWWIQVRTEAEKDNQNAIPVVAFRQNRKPWEFLISASYIGNELGYMRLNQATFKEWALRILNGI